MRGARSARARHSETTWTTRMAHRVAHKQDTAHRERLSLWRMAPVPPFDTQQSIALPMLKAMVFSALAMPLPSHAAEPWFLMARHGECANVASLKRKVPDLGGINDPQTFAAHMRRHGHKVTISPMSVPKGKAYEVAVPEKSLHLLFVTSELCTRTVER